MQRGVVSINKLQWIKSILNGMIVNKQSFFRTIGHHTVEECLCVIHISYL